MQNDKRIHHALLGEVDPLEGPTTLQDVAVEPPPKAPEIAPQEPEDDGSWFPDPDPVESSPRERIEQRIQKARTRANGIAVRALRMLADHLER